MAPIDEGDPLNRVPVHARTENWMERAILVDLARLELGCILPRHAAMVAAERYLGRHATSTTLPEAACARLSFPLTTLARDRRESSAFYRPYALAIQCGSRQG